MLSLFHKQDERHIYTKQLYAIMNSSCIHIYYDPAQRLLKKSFKYGNTSCY
jgi:hypothetical protein